MEATKFQKGDLVWVWYSILNEEKMPGIVVDVRPWVLGGSGVQSRKGFYDTPLIPVIFHEPKRSEYLVVSPSGEFQSWFDEKHLTA